MFSIGKFSLSNVRLTKSHQRERESRNAKRENKIEGCKNIVNIWEEETKEKTAAHQIPEMEIIF